MVINFPNNTGCAYEHAAKKFYLLSSLLIVSPLGVFYVIYILTGESGLVGRIISLLYLGVIKLERNFKVADDCQTVLYREYWKINNALYIQTRPFTKRVKVNSFMSFLSLWYVGSSIVGIVLLVFVSRGIIDETRIQGRLACKLSYSCFVEDSNRSDSTCKYRPVQACDTNVSDTQLYCVHLRHAVIGSNSDLISAYGIATSVYVGVMAGIKALLTVVEVLCAFIKKNTSKCRPTTVVALIMAVCVCIPSFAVELWYASQNGKQAVTGSLIFTTLACLALTQLTISSSYGLLESDLPWKKIERAESSESAETTPLISVEVN